MITKNNKYIAINDNIINLNFIIVINDIENCVENILLIILLK
jgi:hypothetical protein